MSERRIIQLVQSSTGGLLGGTTDTIALCNDGTVWEWDFKDWERAWVKLKDIPQPPQPRIDKDKE